MKNPTKKEVIDIIIENVFIRGIELEPFRRNFEESGIYEELIKLFNKEETEIETEIYESVKFTDQEKRDFIS